MRPTAYLPAVLATASLLLAFAVAGVPHQSQALAALAPEVTYQFFEVGDDGTVGLATACGMRFKEIRPERNYPREHYQLMMLWYCDDSDADDDATSYLPDNPAFPVTYQSQDYDGDDEIREKLGYAPMQNPPQYVGNSRIVLVDDILFWLSDWKSKDDYVIYRVAFLPDAEAAAEEAPAAEGSTGKKKLGGLKAKMKQLAESAAALSGPQAPARYRGADLGAKLQAYLDAATAQQASAYAEWRRNPDNAKREQLIADRLALIEKAITNKNIDYYNSPEYKKIQEAQAFWDNKAATEEVTIVNGTGVEIWIHQSTVNGTSRLEPGDSRTADCRADISYTVGSSSGSRKAFYASGSGCGGTVTAQ